MTRIVARSWILVLAGVLFGGGLTGCGSSESVIGADIDKRVYLVEGQPDMDRPPEIIGGYEEIERLKTYPEAASYRKAAGVIWVEGIISARGVATSFHIAQGGHSALEREALDVVRALDFRPALKRGAPVQALVQIPIIFQIPREEEEEEE